MKIRTKYLGRCLSLVAAFAFGAAHASPVGVYPWPTWTAAIPVTPPSVTGQTYYVDGTGGNDSNPGTSLATAFKTIKKATTVISAGDTVLIRKGLYREGIVSISSFQGAPGKPITFGSYGDGEVILDGSEKLSGWTVHSGSVWKAPIAFTPVAVVVNEVPLKQVRQAPYTSAPAENLAGVISGSGNWYFDSANKRIYADMGGVDPNGADIVVPNNVGDQLHVYFYGASYITLNGLTIRGCGSNGMWTYDQSTSVHSSNIIVQNSTFKFNGKAGLVFNGGKDNQAINNHIHDNVLINWPRGNGGNAEAGGGWPGALGWSGVVRPVARGNIVHHNGGEGIISYGAGTVDGETTGSVLFEQNASYDNWSMNMYVDNQPNGVVRNNILFNHAPQQDEFIYVGNGYPWAGVLEKYRTCLSISDEYGSSADHKAYNVNTLVSNNLIAGCRIGILDYGENAEGHGLRNHRIVNNTIIMDSHIYTSTYTAGIKIQDNGANNTGTLIANNIIHGATNGNGGYNAFFNRSPLVLSDSPVPLTGVSFKNNLYYSSFATPFTTGETVKSFADWASFQGEASSIAADPQFIDSSQFNDSPAATFAFQNAGLKARSPAIDAGSAGVSGYVLNDFSLLKRAQGKGYDIGAFEFRATFSPWLFEFLF